MVDVKGARAGKGVVEIVVGRGLLLMGVANSYPPT